MFARCPGLVPESDFDSVEITLTYEDTSVSVQLNDDLMKKTVLEIKKFLLTYHPDLGNVKETPEELGLLAVVSAGLEERKELCDHKLMEEYKDVLTKCQMLVLERKSPIQT